MTDRTPPDGWEADVFLARSSPPDRPAGDILQETGLKVANIEHDRQEELRRRLIELELKTLYIDVLRASGDD